MIMQVLLLLVLVYIMTGTSGKIIRHLVLKSFLYSVVYLLLPAIVIASWYKN